MLLLVLVLLLALSLGQRLSALGAKLTRDGHVVAASVENDPQGLERARDIQLADVYGARFISSILQHNTVVARAIPALWVRVCLRPCLSRLRRLLLKRSFEPKLRLRLR